MSVWDRHTRSGRQEVGHGPTVRDGMVMHGEHDEFPPSDLPPSMHAGLPLQALAHAGLLCHHVPLAILSYWWRQGHDGVTSVGASAGHTIWEAAGWVGFTAAPAPAPAGHMQFPMVLVCSVLQGGGVP